MRILVAVIRALVAVAIVAAVVGQLVTSLAYWEANGVRHVGLSVWSFFSFFTIQSNVLAAVALGVGAGRLLAGRIPDGIGWTTFRAATTTYMVITGIVYNLLLRGIELPQGATLGWSNEVLHVVAPAWVLVDWLIAPGRARLAWSRVVAILAFPIAWIAYTLVRGPFIPNEIAGEPHWYPYPFLDPNLPGASYGTVAVYVVGIAVAMAAVGLAVILVSRRFPQRD